MFSVVKVTQTTELEVTYRPFSGVPSLEMSGKLGRFEAHLDNEHLHVALTSTRGVVLDELLRRYQTLLLLNFVCSFSNPHVKLKSKDLLFSTLDVM